MDTKICLKVMFVITFFFSSFFSYSQSEVFRVALDAGHGGHDAGAKYSGRVEKDVALAVVLKVGKILEESKKAEVVYTRKTDVFIELNERANIANRARASIFVSIHCNANKNLAADGTETYVMGMTKIASNLEAAKKENSVITLEKDYKQKYEGFDPNSPETMIGMTLMQEEYLDNSISLASKVENEFQNLGKKIRGGGVKQAPYLVLHRAYMPRVLIEMGFISNPEEGAVLVSEQGQNDLAQAIAKAIIKYKNEFFESEGFENFPTPKVDATEKKEIIKPKDTSDFQEAAKVSTTPITGTIFKVQLSASYIQLELQPKNFKGLNFISMERDNNLYKYFYGETTDFNVAKENLKAAKAKGYDSAFLIAYKNGKKISIQEAIK
ncbi:N-acetylmuramoyl-L-alanine amidase [Flavobacterium sp.]|jgi:N-acetylmuramoyl-L-alanine amidase|uniref:N-acetylmuramoyl-L-alanine amidase family protein n=1 Tax=Flavobacterium sp. TaxID=239 RepID=UPI0022BB818F|nr:N-acetylmuramoyl-L-alanine amidase [Flavobacterium sp.]MCZ8229377.1 N-acetylmuramoyl-L-alanine amidase [Flavobacterium sp.]